jgi:hypothetical protein
MAMKITNGTADAALTAIGALLNNGRIIIYSGTEPTNAGTALSGNTALADIALAATAFGTAVADDTDPTARKIEAAGVPRADTSADATGSASFFRAYKSTGTALADVVYQGTCGTTGQQLNLNDVNIIATGNVSIISLKIVMPTA